MKSVIRRSTGSSADSHGWPEAARIASRIIALPSSEAMKSEIKDLPEGVRPEVSRLVSLQMRMFKQGPFLLYWCPTGTQAKDSIQNNKRAE